MADDLEYEVGYRKPPKAFQFQQGRSGNPSGRPGKPLGSSDRLAKTARQKVRVNGNNGPQYITKEDAICMQWEKKAGGGVWKETALKKNLRITTPPGRKNPEKRAPRAGGPKP